MTDLNTAFDTAMKTAIAAAIPHIVTAVVQALGNTPAAAAPAPAPAPAPAADPFGGLGGGTPTPAPAKVVTPEMLQSLIMPLVQNEATKAMLKTEMDAMGIANLGDTTPAQLPELYARFERVAGQAAGATPAPAPSII